jgi:hypothetical protein
MNTEHDWTVWWNNEGSGMRPLNGQDHESHVRDMTRIAWLNGAFGSADKIDRLRAELADVCRKSAQALVELSSNLCATSARERERIVAERDEARHGESVATATLQGVIEERTALRAERDRKNLTIQALTEERDELVRMANKLTAERDDARREVCSRQPFAHHDDGIAKDHAAYRGWDCYKEAK